MPTTSTSASTNGATPIAVIPGDGIGKEVMPPAISILQAAANKFSCDLQLTEFDFASCDYYESHGKMLPDDWVETLRKFDCIYFGAVGDPKRVPDHVSLWGNLLLFRRQFDQCIFLWRCTQLHGRGGGSPKLIPGVPSSLANPGPIDFWIVRENTEGEYSEIGGRIVHGTDRELVAQQTVMTRQGVDRILRYAFELARSRPAKHLTSATKSNGISVTMPYWDERVEEMGKEYPEVKVDKFHIDILTAHFVQRPTFFDVVVGSNLLGDIQSDLGPAVTGTIGIAPSGNIDPTGAGPRLFEPAHGSASDIMGQGIANPVGMIWAGSMMLRHLVEAQAADAILAAIERITPDMGRKGNTKAFAKAIEDALVSGQ
ncbi:putative tartrate dehydrogenase [Tilletiaria anomala UBC 951]|uniref:Putative tartrate dehydrogenase n=1 Tax=Tilletiaria anomala (strain ATCC 24038 / CBS 436.72 / UBC 951) TaxID=1037660 RepID=A0A066W9D7_TILAU|nr:putative tartrate dehydrogenase [Tilletiaria anomala UBC 951]KDN47355.1 putative tartrate dehydrogenase [Tilletiaria anomala UBC 951]